MFDVTTKLEINVIGGEPVDVQDLIATAAKARVAAIVVDRPEFIPQLQFMRMSTGGQFRIILAVDFASMGKNFALRKFSHMNPSWMDAEGYDVLLSPRQSPMEIKNEIRAIATHLRSLNPVCELRFCINALNFPRDVVNNMVKFIQAQTDPRPTLIRMDQNLHMPGRVASEFAPKILQTIRASCPLGVKVSTNVTLEDIRTLRTQIARFDVTLRDAKHIIHLLREEAKKPKTLLDAEEDAPHPNVVEWERDEFNPPADLGLADEHVVGEDDATVIDLNEVDDAPTTITTSSSPTFNVRLAFNADGSLASPIVEEVRPPAPPSFSDPIEDGRMQVPELDE